HFGSARTDRHTGVGHARQRTGRHHHGSRLREGAATASNRQGGETMLVIALCKGRFLDPSLEMLGRAGIRFSDDVATSRKLIFESDDKRHRAVLVKPADVPTYVEYGAADLGIAGRDVLLESQADVLQPLDLNFGHCKIAVAEIEGRTPNSERQEFGVRPSISARVATKYPRITRDYYNA